jgi:hypothetical protein
LQSEHHGTSNYSLPSGNPFAESIDDLPTDSDENPFADSNENPFCDPINDPFCESAEEPVLQ